MYSAVEKDFLYDNVHLPQTHKQYCTALIHWFIWSHRHANFSALSTLSDKKMVLTIDRVKWRHSSLRSLCCIACCRTLRS